MPTSPELLTVKGAATALSVGRSTIYDLMNSGELPSIRIGSARRIPAVAISDLIARQLTASQAQRVGLALLDGHSEEVDQPGGCGLGDTTGRAVAITQRVGAT